MKAKLFFFVCAALILLAGACKGKEGQEMNEEKKSDASQREVVKKVIYSPVAGSWYPGTKDALLRDLNSYLEKADIADLAGYHGPILGLISPHAGYRYSGGVAAHGYKALIGRKVKRVIVMGPSHYLALRGLAITDATHWETPLGQVPLDAEAAARLKAESSLFSYRDDAFRREHSIDMQIPFIQVVAPNAVIVPIVVGHIGPSEAKEAGKALRKIVDSETVIVASSDFTHYGPNYGYVPFRDNVADRLADLALQAAKPISSLDVDGFFEHLDRTGDTICGAAPISVLLAALPAESEAVPLKFDTSGRMTGDYTNSVSYFSIAFIEKRSPPKFVGVDIVDEATQEWLLKLSRETLRRHLEGKPLPDPEKEGRPIPPKAREVYGVFVTLKKHGDLRGCIGSIVGTEPLYKGVIRNTVNAASHDPRFEPMSLSEEPEVEIEISILTPLKEVSSYQDIRLGRDGIVIEKAGRRAVFLPQVAPEQGWDLPTTLTHLSWKAGLDGDAWREGMRFQTFQAQVFHEKGR